MFSLAIPCQAKHLHHENYYQNIYCNGIKEYRLPDKTRIDCLTDNEVIEFDFAEKWAEGIGQVLHYSRMTNKQPTIMLIIEKESDYRYLKRLKPIADKENIKIRLLFP